MRCSADSRGLKRLGRAGIKTERLVRTGGNAAMTSGQRARGVFSSMLLWHRRAAAAAACCSSLCGANLDLAWAMADDDSKGGADPAFEVHLGVLQIWAMAAWKRWAPVPLLDKLIEDATVRLGRARNVWAVVYGPAAALIATLRRLK